MPSLNMFDLVHGFTQVVDMVNNTLADHHQRVAYIADLLCQRLQMNRKDWNRTVMAAMVHDVGVIPLHDQTDNLVFEKDMERHSIAGWLLLDSCPVFRHEARIIRYHHTDWSQIKFLPLEMQDMARLGNIVYLADEADVYVRTNSSVNGLTKIIKSQAGMKFSARAVEAALDIFSAPGFFETLTEASSGLSLAGRPELMLSELDASLFSLLFSNIIDTRSPFTATHSTGVAHIARFLHQALDFPQEDQSSIFVAGLLHDIGKLGVPLELLEKNGRLEPDEFKAVSCHALLSKHVLKAIAGFEKVAPWASMHHEKLNGTGYPDALPANDIPLESRLMAVADILTALSEDRPYRPGMNRTDCLKILDTMVKEQSLDKDMVAAVHDNYDDITSVRVQAQTLAARFFRDLTRDIRTAVSCAA